MARVHRRPDLCRRHPRPPRSQRPSHRSRRRESQTPTLQIDPKGLTTSPTLPKIYCQQGARQPGDIISESAGDIVGIRMHTVGGIVLPGSPLAATQEELQTIAGFWPDVEKSRAEAKRLLK